MLYFKTVLQWVKMGQYNNTLPDKPTWHQCLTYTGSGCRGGFGGLGLMLGGLGGMGGGDGDLCRGAGVGRASTGSRSMTWEFSGDSSSGKKSNAVNTSWKKCTKYNQITPAWMKKMILYLADLQHWMLDLDLIQLVKWKNMFLALKVLIHNLDLISDQYIGNQANV